MLAIQPISLNSTKNASFKGIYDNQESYERERRYFENQGREFDGIINDDNIPEGMKKPFKFARIITNGIIDGLAVGWAVMAGANSCKKAASSKYAKNISSAAKPIAEGFAKTLKNFGEIIAKRFQKIKDNKFAQKVSALYDKVANSKFGKPVIEFTKKSANVVVEFAKTIINAIKGVTYDKASKTAAGVLGGGSGIAGAYATAREENPVELEEGEEI